MKTLTIFWVLITSFVFQTALAQNVGIGTTNPDPSAMLEINAAEQGILVPRMSTTNRINITSPAIGLLVYDNTTNTFWFYSGSEWVELKGNDNLGNHQAVQALIMNDNDIVGTNNISIGGVIYDNYISTGGQGKFLESDNGTGIKWNIVSIDDLSDGRTIGYSTFLGNGSGLNDDGTNNYNTGIGNHCLLTNTSGENNSALGNSSLYHNISGDRNTAMGNYSLFYNELGNENTAIGAQSLHFNENSGSTGIGFAAMEFMNETYSGINTFNTAIGHTAMKGSVQGGNTGVKNTAIGALSMNNISTGTNNVAIGVETLKNNAIGSNNTMIGAEAGKNATGSNNLFLGYKAGFNETSNDKLYIENSDSESPLIWGNFSSDEVNINGHFQVTQSFRDKDGDPGTNGQILSSTSTGIDWVDVTGEDNLGNHIATQNLHLSGNEIAMENGWISNDGDEEGIYIESLFGDVGLGTNVPKSRLHLFEGTGGFTGTYINTADLIIEDDDKTYIVLNPGSSENGGMLFCDNGSSQYAGMVYHTSSNNLELLTGANTRMTITESGAVGIGLTNPDEMLHIGGTIRINGGLEDKDGQKGTVNQILASTGTLTDWINPSINLLVDGRTLGYSTFLGEGSGDADDGSNNQNTALGYLAMNQTNSGTGNTAHGFQALRFNTTGNYNTALGNTALQSNGNGGQNTAVGNGTLFNNTSGTANTAVGDNAMVSNLSGGSNTAFGENALNSNQSGSFNVALGPKAGYGATGNLNVFIGNEAGYSETGDNKLYIENSNSAEPLIWGDFTSNEVKINGSLTVTNHFRDTDGFAAGNGELLFGTSLGTTWRFAAINDLSNGITDENSTYLGNGAGVSDDLTNNKNTGLGHQALNANINGEYNAASGHQALFSNISGSYNTANGHQALYSNTGSYNTAIGSLSLFNNSTGSFNTALGFGALSYNKGNWGSVAIGYNAMYNANNTVSANYTYNTALGFEALKGSNTPSNNTGQSNTSVGYQTLFSNSSGGLNIAVGAGALYSNTLGSSNTAIGNGALYSNKGNSGSTAIGHNAMFYAYDYAAGWFTCNTAVGFEALRGSTSAASNTGHSNTTVGHKSSFSNTSGDYNTSMGREALYSNTSGDYNTAIGYQAGYLSNGAGNVFLGHTAGYFESGSNKLYIDNTNTSNPLLYGDFGADQLKVNEEFQVTSRLRDSGGDAGNNGQILSSTGSGTNWVNPPVGDNLGNHYATQDINMASSEIALNGGWISGDGEDEGLTVNNAGMVGIGTPNPSADLHIKQGGSNPGIILEYHNDFDDWRTYIDEANDYNFAYNGTLKAYILDTDGSYITVSDKRLKRDIRSLESLLTSVKKINPVQYRFKDAKSSCQPTIGLIAQEIRELFPETVSEKNGFLAVNYDAFGVIAIKAIQEQQEQIEQMSEKLEKLEAVVEQLLNNNQ
jgi:hypothetical protein